MPRRKPPIEDTRPKWDDPDLPVFGKSGRAIHPDKMVLAAQIKMARADEPTYRNDPTYDLRKKK